MERKRGFGISKGEKMNGSFIKSKDNVTIQLGGRVVTVGLAFAESSGVLDALRKGDFKTAILKADKATNVRKRSGGAFEVTDGVVYHNGQPLHNVVTERIVELADGGYPFSPMVKFLENLLENPSKRAVDELYTFLEHENLPITEDGHFLAYKTVGSDFYSKAGGKLTLLSGKANSSGQIFNGVGEVIECVRNEVDDDKDRTCSKGLHVGALGYAGVGGWYHSQGDNVVIVKVNPRDAVSVPSDHSGQKLRTCRYEVIGLFDTAFAEPVTDATGNVFDRTRDEVTCDNCDWVGSYLDLEDDYTCPDCLSDEYIHALQLGEKLSRFRG